jgi:hypothetical protein
MTRAWPTARVMGQCSDKGSNTEPPLHVWSSELSPTPRGCERICERNAARRPRWRGTRRDGLDGRLTVTCTFEPREATRDGDRLAHNPEVAGSNPVPATSGNGPRRSLRGPFSCRLGTIKKAAAFRRLDCAPHTQGPCSTSPISTSIRPRPAEAELRQTQSYRGGVRQLRGVPPTPRCKGSPS